MFPVAEQKILINSLIFIIVLLAALALLSYLTSLFVDDELLRLNIYIIASPLITLFFHLVVSKRKLGSILIVGGTRFPSSLSKWVVASLALLVLFFIGVLYTQEDFWSLNSAIQIGFVVLTAISIGYIVSHMDNEEIFRHAKYVPLAIIVPMLPVLIYADMSFITGEAVQTNPFSFSDMLAIFVSWLFFFVLHMGQMLREELTFRGYLMRNFARYPMMGIVLVGLVFGLWHIPIFLFTDGMVNWEYLSVEFVLPAILDSFLVGTLFAYLYLRTKNLVLPAIAHSLDDTMRDFALWAPMYAGLPQLLDYFSFDESWLIAGRVVFALVVVALITRLIDRPPPKEEVEEMEA